MKDFPLISVAAIAFNMEPYIKKSILSVLNQNYPNLEMLVIDDGSTDDTIAVLQSIAATHPRGNCLKIIAHGTNRGPGAARNTALEAARGKYFYFIDADDFIKPDTLKLLYETISRTHDQFVGAAHSRITPTGKLLQNILVTPGHYCGNNAVSKLLQSNYMDVTKLVFLWNRLYDLSFLRKFDIKCDPDMRFTEDSWFSYQAYTRATSFTILPDITYSYVIRPSASAARENMLKERETKCFIRAFNLISADLDQKLHRGDKVPVIYFDCFAYVYLFLHTRRYLEADGAEASRNIWLDNLSTLTATTSWTPENFHTFYGKLILASLHWHLTRQEWLQLYKLGLKLSILKKAGRRLKIFSEPELRAETIKKDMTKLFMFLQK